MAYLHCHNCYWSQDDFWSEKYNPITFLEENYKDDLLNKDLDEIITIEKTTNRDFVYFQKITRREFIAQMLEEHANIIRKMKYKTNNDFKQDKNPTCPGCGKNKFDID